MTFPMPAATPSQPRRALVWRMLPLLAALLLFAGIGWGGRGLYLEREQRLRHQVEGGLRAISLLQTQGVADWRARRMAEAAALSDDSLFAAAVARWRASPGPAAQAPVQERLRILMEHAQYTVAYLVDTQGTLLLGPDGPAPRRLHAPEHAALQQALEEARPAEVELHHDAEFPYPAFSQLVPLFNGTTPVGAVWLVLDVRSTLYPLLESWHANSRTAESLLVVRQGDDLVYLNARRHQDGDPGDEPFTVRQPLAAGPADDPAVLAVQGTRGILYGRDYRGQPVVAMASAVPGSPWLLVSKADVADVFAEARLRERQALGGLAALGLLLAAATAAWGQWRAWRRERALKTALEQLVRLDPLTQVANRLALDEAVVQEWSRAQREGTPLALLMIDVDHFKAYNDHYGHVAGDQCLRSVARTLSSGAGLRATDLVARYGGEEFAVLLPGTSAADAVQVARRLCEAVSAAALEHGASPDGDRVTISAGVASLKPGAASQGRPGVDAALMLFQQADAALYRAKQDGRNRVAIYVPPPPPHDL